MARSPIERMIDEACGYDPDKPEPPKAMTADEIGRAIANEVIDHMRSYYPAMLSAVPANAQRSIKGVIRNAMTSYAPRLVARS
jgi:hypothetical protein